LSINNIVPYIVWKQYTLKTMPVTYWYCYCTLCVWTILWIVYIIEETDNDSYCEDKLDSIITGYYCNELLLLKLLCSMIDITVIVIIMVLLKLRMIMAWYYDIIGYYYYYDDRIVLCVLLLEHYCVRGRNYYWWQLCVVLLTLCVLLVCVITDMIHLKSIEYYYYSVINIDICIVMQYDDYIDMLCGHYYYC